jgi:hypothetical protein
MDDQRTNREGGGSVSKPQRGLRFLYILAGIFFTLYAIGLVEAVRVLRIWQVVALLAVCAIAGISLLAIGILGKRDQFNTRIK